MTRAKNKSLVILQHVVWQNSIKTYVDYFTKLCFITVWDRAKKHVFRLAVSTRNAAPSVRVTSRRPPTQLVIQPVAQRLVLANREERV